MSHRSTLLSTLLTLIQAWLLGIVLSACGGGQSADAGNAPRMAAATVQAAAVPADYAQAVQQLYVAYFGRPADPGGLANFEAALQGAAAPTDIQALDNAYNSNASIRALVDAFGVSTESQGLYTGDTTAFVQTIYQHLLNRAPLPLGLAYWVDAIDHGGLQRGNAALSIMAAALANGSAQGLLDAALIGNKIAIASNFTTVVPVTTYRGQTIAALARAMLASVTGNTNVEAFQATISSTISAMQAANVKSYAGNYSGSYSGADAGVFTFTIADNGAVSGSGHSTAFGYDLMIAGSIAEGGAVSLTAQGTAGAATYVGTLNASTGSLNGTWNAGIYGSGTFSGQRY